MAQRHAPARAGDEMADELFASLRDTPAGARGAVPREAPARTIAAGRLRDDCDVVAVVVSIEATAHPIRLVDVVVDDGTATLCCRFFGRCEIPGVELGRWLRVAGVITLHVGRACLLNPVYELCDPPCPDSQR